MYTCILGANLSEKIFRKVNSYFFYRKCESRLRFRLTSKSFEVTIASFRTIFISIDYIKV